MKKQIKTIIGTSTRSGLRPLLFGALVVAVTLLPAADMEQMHADHGSAVPAKLVQTVRTATVQFINVNAATAAGYQPLFGCVSGPDRGAMGVHYINLALYGDGKLDVTRPEALIYEPTNRGLVLVGVE